MLLRDRVTDLRNRHLLGEHEPLHAMRSGTPGGIYAPPVPSAVSAVRDILENANTPDTAEEGKAFTVTWCNGMGRFCVADRRAISGWLLQEGAAAGELSVSYGTVPPDALITICDPALDAFNKEASRRIVESVSDPKLLMEKLSLNPAEWFKHVEAPKPAPTHKPTDPDEGVERNAWDTTPHGIRVPRVGSIHRLGHRGMADDGKSEDEHHWSALITKAEHVPENHPDHRNPGKVAYRVSWTTPNSVLRKNPGMEAKIGTFMHYGKPA